MCQTPSNPVPSMTSTFIALHLPRCLVDLRGDLAPAMAGHRDASRRALERRPFLAALVHCPGTAVGEGAAAARRLTGVGDARLRLPASPLDRRIRNEGRVEQRLGV